MPEPQAATPAPAAPQSFDDKLSAIVDNVTPELAAEAPTAPQEGAEAPPEGELKPEEIEGQEAPVDAREWIEIEQDGGKKRLSREEARKYAALGIEAETVVEATKAERAALAAERQAVLERGKITPVILDAAANVRLYERAMQSYQQVNWADMARTNPSEYLAQRAQFEQIRDGYGAAYQQLQQASAVAQQADQKVDAATLQRQLQIVGSKAPDLRDAHKFASETGRMRGYLSEVGFTESEQNMVTDARVFEVVRDAMRYRQAVKARAERVKTAPSLSPGAAPERVSAKEAERQIVNKLHQTKDRGQRNALIDQALAAKLSRLG